MNKIIAFFKRLTITTILSSLFFCTYAQNERNSIIRGTIRNEESVLEYAVVFLKDTQISTNSDESGNFILRLPAGKHILCVSYVGYQTYEKQIEIKPNEKQICHIQLKKENNSLSEVIVEAKSPVQRINESAYNAIAIDAKVLRNTNMDVAQVLDRVTGIKIREDGGVGSSTQINLNGFTGRHVKFFMDGIPLDGSGDGFPINSIPLGVAERIEVYKGVVPIEFGADALGGAINIVTGKSTNTFVDASYSYGSFNTHKSSLSFGHTLKNGLTMQLNAYQNYSDNDYKVKVKEYLDLDNGQQLITKPTWFRRFHDRFHNESVMAKVGVVKKNWADRLMFGIIYTHEDAQIQNANIMEIVFGGKKRKSKNFAPTVEYEKRNLIVKNLNLSLSARYDRDRTNNIDTLARQYSWTGDYVNKTTQGEADRTVAKSIDKSGYVTSSINYKIADKHLLSLSNVFSDFRRDDKDEASTKATTDRKSQKDIFGFSYKFSPNEKWNALAFVKNYYTYVKGPVDTTKNSSGRYAIYTKDYNLTGFGAAATYYFLPSIQAKISFEKTYRLPNPKELFGDGSLEKGRADINPENSKNLNLNLLINHTFNHHHTISIETGFIYRDIRDFIKREIDNKGYGGSINLKKVLGIGGEFEAHYFYKNNFSFGGNLTYQNMRNKNKVSVNDPLSNIYNDRIPNIPYFFGNADVNYNFHDLLVRGNALLLTYNMHYVHKFYKSWQGNRGQGANISVPRQISHDASVTYTLRNSKYNIAFEVRNLTDKLLYDNYSLQKPGRSFSVKFRYLFFKQNK